MRRIARLSLVAGAAAAVIGGAVVAGPTFAAPGGGACTLHGSANFNPGVGAGTQFAYTFTGDLTNCNSSTAQGPDQDGKISAGLPFTVGGATYNPVDTPTGNGDCSNGTTAGTAVVTWADGTVTFIQYTTNSVAAAVQLSGTVVDSITATDGSGAVVSVPATNTTYSSANGDTAQGALAFEVTNPVACQDG